MSTLENELRGTLAGLVGGGSRDSGRNADIIIARYGWDGAPPRTLQAVGDEFGITRERVRQVCVRASRRLSKGTRPMMPLLDEALTLFAQSVPCEASSFGAKLVESGLSERGIDGAGMLGLADFFGHELDAVLVELGEVRLVVDRDSVGLAGKVRQTARKLVGTHGVATVAEITAELWGELDEVEQERREKSMRLELEADPTVVWLDGDRRWLWLTDIPDGRNRLLNNVRKVLSVSGEIDATDLRRAVRRDWRMGGYAPPARILLAFAEAVPELERADGVIKSTHSYSREQYLSDTEYVIVEVILEHEGVMRFENLRRVALDYGVGDAAFKQRMSQSPVIRKYAPCVYGLSGVDASPDAVDALTVPTQRSRVLQDCGWTDDGRLWVAYQLSTNTVQAAVLAVPAVVRDFILGEHQLEDPTGRASGTLVVRGQAAWGIRRFLGRSGAEPGDTLLLVFDLARRVCQCYLGDETVRDEVLAD